MLCRNSTHAEMGVAWEASRRTCVPGEGGVRPLVVRLAGTSFSPQYQRWVDTRRPARRHVARNHCCEHEEHGCPCQGQRVSRREAEEQALHHTHSHKRSQESNSDSYRRDEESSTNQWPQNVETLCAKRNANAEIPQTATNVVRHDTIALHSTDDGKTREGR
jgi:5-methylcytosine-specific restriction endonuclease McrA